MPGEAAVAQTQVGQSSDRVTYDRSHSACNCKRWRDNGIGPGGLGPEKEVP